MCVGGILAHQNGVFVVYQGLYLRAGRGLSSAEPQTLTPSFSPTCAAPAASPLSATHVTYTAIISSASLTLRNADPNAKPFQ